MNSQTADASQRGTDLAWSVSMQSLRRAFHQELDYLDILISTPFRVLERQLQPIRAAWRPDAEVAMQAVEGMVRLPLQILADVTKDSVESSAPVSQEK